MKPTPGAIRLVLSEMADPNFRSEPAAHCWWVSAYDVAGELQGIGVGTTLERATAGAWINAWLSEFDYSRPLSRDEQASVPLIAPTGWRFEVDDQVYLVEDDIDLEPPNSSQSRLLS